MIFLIYKVKENVRMNVAAEMFKWRLWHTLYFRWTVLVLTMNVQYLSCQEVPWFKREHVYWEKKFQVQHACVCSIVYSTKKEAGTTLNIQQLGIG